MKILDKIMQMQNGSLGRTHQSILNGFAFGTLSNVPAFVPPKDGELLILSKIEVEGDNIILQFKQTKSDDEYLQLASITVGGEYASA